MRYEEAIKHLQNLKFKFMDEYVDYDNTAEAFQHGIEALKKQIPMKPLENKLMWAVCPNCKGSIHKDNFRIHERIVRNDTTFCEHCGQALDWSDEN